MMPGLAYLDKLTARYYNARIVDYSDRAVCRVAHLVNNSLKQSVRHFAPPDI